MTKTAVTDVDSLLAEARWVETFARALVREDSDDVAQDAWLAAIQRPPAPAASPRPWFATVMRNLQRMRFRSASRRRAREDASTTDAQVPTPAELTHRLELQRRLASAVLALEEPQRSTIVLVFYEGLSPAEISRRQGVPATTVRSRVRAALVALRAALDAEEGGDRGRWHLALAPIAVSKLVPASAPLWPLAFAAIAAVATTAVVVRAAHRVDDHTITAVSPATASASSPTIATTPGRPRGASTPAIVTTGDVAVSPPPSISPAFREAERTLMAHVDECYALSHDSGRDLKGIVRMIIALDTTDRVAASVDIDTRHTTITDPEFLECIRENATAIEEHLERLRQRGEPIEGPITLHVAREMPPTADGAQLVFMSTGDEPGDDDSPACPAGTALAGTHRKQQWCALPDGTKHGPEWVWDPQGHVTSRASYDNGATTRQLRQGSD